MVKYGKTMVEHGQIWLKMVMHGRSLVEKWSNKGPKMVERGETMVEKQSTHGQQMVRTWPKKVDKWSKNGQIHG